MDFLLEPGETIVYRTRTAWGGIFWFWLFILALMAGFFCAWAAGAALTGKDIDWPGFISVNVLFLIALCLFGLGLVVRAVRTAAAITDRRVLYRGWLDSQPLQISRENIADTQLRETDTPTPSIRITGTDGAVVELRWIDSAHEMHQRLARGIAITPRPLSNKTHGLMTLGIFSMTMGAVAGFAMGAVLLDLFLIPALEVYGDAVTATGFSKKMGDFLLLLILVVTVLPPLMSLALFGGFIGSLPILLCTPLVLSRDAAKDMARYVRRQENCSVAPVTILHFGFPLPVLDRLLRFWIGGPGRFYIKSAERLLSFLYREPIPFT